MCVVFLKDYYISKTVSLSLISFCVVVLLWLITKSVFYVVTAVLSLVTICIIHGFKTRNKILSLCTTDFYLEEDIVVDFQKQLKIGRSGTGHNYKNFFEKYGKHTISLRFAPTIEIPLHKERNISSLYIDRLSTESCSKGDLFYLLICDEGEKKKIVQSFYKYHFDVQTEDFNYIDGKYYCKEIWSTIRYKTSNPKAPISELFFFIMFYLHTDEPDAVNNAHQL